MRRVSITLLAVMLPLAAAVPSRAATVNLQLSNFRFCPASAPMCGPQDQAYLAAQDGPPAFGYYNPFAITMVEPGDVVVWTYADEMCDAMSGCAGHQIRFRDGTQTELAPARSGAAVVSWQVPMDAQPGALIPYWCPVNDHFSFGTTGALQVTSVDPY